MPEKIALLRYCNFELLKFQRKRDIDPKGNYSIEIKIVDSLTKIEHNAPERNKHVLILRQVNYGNNFKDSIYCNMESTEEQKEQKDEHIPEQHEDKDPIEQELNNENKTLYYFKRQQIAGQLYNYIDISQSAFCNEQPEGTFEYELDLQTDKLQLCLKELFFDKKWSKAVFGVKPGHIIHALLPNGDLHNDVPHTCKYHNFIVLAVLKDRFIGIACTTTPPQKQYQEGEYHVLYKKHYNNKTQPQSDNYAYYHKLLAIPSVKKNWTNSFSFLLGQEELKTIKEKVIEHLFM